MKELHLVCKLEEHPRVVALPGDVLHGGVVHLQAGSTCLISQLWCNFGVSHISRLVAAAGAAGETFNTLQTP